MIPTTIAKVNGHGNRAWRHREWRLWLQSPSVISRCRRALRAAGCVALARACLHRHGIRRPGRIAALMSPGNGLRPLPPPLLRSAMRPVRLIYHPGLFATRARRRVGSRGPVPVPQTTCPGTWAACAGAARHHRGIRAVVVPRGAGQARAPFAIAPHARREQRY